NIGGASGSLVALEQTPLVLLPSLTLSDPDSATLASVRVGFSVGRIVGEAAARCRGSWPTSATPSRGAPAPTISTATPATAGWTAAPGTTPPRAGGATTAYAAARATTWSSATSGTTPSPAAPAPTPWPAAAGPTSSRSRRARAA